MVRAVDKADDTLTLSSAL